MFREFIELLVRVNLYINGIGLFDSISSPVLRQPPVPDPDPDPAAPPPFRLC